MIAAGLFESTVQTWDLDSRTKLAQFETPLEFGGRRLALSNDGSLCAAASWRGGRRGGVAGYEAQTGIAVWHRPKLAETQSLSFSADGAGLWYMPDTGSTLRLDVRTGATVEKLVGVRRVFEDPRGSARLLVRNRGLCLKASTGIVRIKPQKVLDAVLDGTRVCVSEMGSLLRCFDYAGAELWRFDAGTGSHVIRVWSEPSLDYYYGVTLNYAAQKYQPRLLIFDRNSGSHEVLAAINSGEVAATAKLDRLVTRNGTIYRMSDGADLGRLQFPQREYADPM
jgi:outer membrane protein assembly factor BamB